MSQLPQTITQTTNDLIDERLRAGTSITFTIPTTSMLPTLAPGDQVLVRVVHDSLLRDWRIGDILLLQTRGVWVAHRLVERGTSMRTKGDYAACADPELDRTQVRGVVIGVRRRNGNTIDYLTRRARRVNAFIARCSRGQARFAATPTGIGWRIVRRLVRAAIWSIAQIARWIMG